MLALYNAYVAPYLMGALDREDEGQGMVEYGLIIALVSVVAAAVLILLGDEVVATIEDATAAFGGA